MDTAGLGGLRHLPDSLVSLGLMVESGDHGAALLARCRGLLHLSIGDHKRLPPTLDRLTALRTLHVGGPIRDLNILSTLAGIEELTLRSVSIPDLRPLLPLRRLTSLDIKLGGTRDLSLLPELGPPAYLELWLVRALEDISAIGGITTLESLKLESLARITTLPDLSRLTRLRKVELNNMKGLKDLAPLASAPGLESLWLIASQHLTPDALLPLVGHPMLRTARLGLGSLRKNAQATALLGLPQG